MDNILEKLVDLGLSKIEAMVYVTLLKNGKNSGYKIAKELNLYRSTVYQAIDSLYQKGYIYLIETQNKEYEAKDPNIFLKEIQTKLESNITSLRGELNSIRPHLKKDYFINITGIENILLKVKAMLDSSKKEIYLNTDFDIKLIQDNLYKAARRGVRVIIFSFGRLEGIDETLIEVYNRNEFEKEIIKSQRLMITVDLEETLVASQSNSEVTAIFTNNSTFNLIVAEHIHSDIYLSKIKKIDSSYFKENIGINSLHEKLTFLEKKLK